MPTSPRIRRVAAIASLAVVLAAGCGDDDGAGVRDITPNTDAESGSASASGSGSASGSASASAGATADAPCVPVGESLESSAPETVEIVMTDHRFDQERYEASAGVVTFVVDNRGDSNHEVAFLPGGGRVPLIDGVVDEAALAEAGAFELEAFGPGQTCNATYDLAPGTYTLFCIVEAEDGETHLAKGMQATLVVT